MGIASFINYFEAARILVITTASDQLFFKTILTNAPCDNLSLADSLINLEVYRHEGIYFVDIDCIARIVRKNTEIDYEQLVASLSNSFDCILCDLPEVLENKTPNLEIYLPIYKIANNVSVIFASNKSSFKKVDKLMNYFSSYNIKVKGALFSDNLKGGA